MYLSVHSVVLSCHLFLSPFTLCHSKWVSILFPDYEIMEVLWNGHKFCYFYHQFIMILSVMKPYTIRWPQDLQHLWCSKPSVICLQLTDLSQLFQHWYTMSTWITQSINFSKSKRDENDDLVRYDMWFKKNAGHCHRHERWLLISRFRA